MSVYLILKYFSEVAESKKKKKRGVRNKFWNSSSTMGLRRLRSSINTRGMAEVDQVRKRKLSTERRQATKTGGLTTDENPTAMFSLE